MVDCFSIFKVLFMEILINLVLPGIEQTKARNCQMSFVLFFWVVLSIFLLLKLVLYLFIYFSCKIYSSYKNHYCNSDLYSKNNYIIYISILLVSMCIIIHTPVPMYIMYIIIVWNFLLFVTVFLDTKHFLKAQSS